MIKLFIFFLCFTNSRLKNKKFHFELLTRWVHFYFCNYLLRNVKLINEKNCFIIAVSKRHGLPHSIMFFVFSLLCCKYICYIYLSTLEFNGLCKFSNIFINKITTAGLYNYNGRQIELFHLKWFNYG